MLAVPTKTSIHENYISTAVTSHASDPTQKGSVVQLTAGTLRDAHMVVVTLSRYAIAATQSQMCADLLIGASTEEVLIPNMLGGGAGLMVYQFPLYIPAGSRLATRQAGSRGGIACAVQIDLVHFPGGPPFEVGTWVDALGIGTIPNGVTITPGVLDAEGAWTEIEDSTIIDYLSVQPGFHPTGDTTTALRSYRVDLGIGAATEEELAGNWTYLSTSDETMAGFSWPCFKKIPVGSRISMRASNATSGNDSGYSGVVYGVR